MGQVYQIADKPIVVSEQAQFMTIETVRENRAGVRELFAKMAGKKYLIIDLRQTETSFFEILKIMFESGKGRDKTISSDNTMTFIVGGDKFIQMFRDKMQNQGGIQLAVFTDMDAVMEAIEIDMTRNRAG